MAMNWKMNGAEKADNRQNLIWTNNAKIELLSDENETLVGKIDRLQERLQVLERIATDPAKRTADEIEALREQN